MGQPTTLHLFADELRRARAAAGMSQDALSHQINYSASLVAKIELSERRPGRDFAQRCDAALDTGGLLSRIHDTLSDTVLPWFREWLAIEREATTLRSYEPLVVPGLLQTEGYARALLDGASRFTEDEIEPQVAARMERQAVLTRDHPPQLVVVLDEYVLRRPVGGPAVMADQLRHLAEVGRRCRVHLHVVPAGVGAYAGLNGAFVVATPPDGDDVAYLDNQLQGQVVDRAADVLSVRQTWESVRAEALSHGQTMDLITEATRTWT
ncbi:helix-turn-helix transcriptional regulator [Micromonospora sp. NPDC049679]|uniref:helix-turn-helix domain-containing protein n=1 Tax=Micromonospora sp. NPDC049679 TaxID=3155920 RepID=UPI0033BFEDEE